MGGYTGRKRGSRVIEINERNKVEQHNRRALIHKQPATLTFDEWMATLEYFQFKCAYCGGKYQVLEHVDCVRFSGTTKANCVPACNSCNARKYDRPVWGWDLPEYSKGLFNYWLQHFLCDQDVPGLIHETAAQTTRERV